MTGDGGSARPRYSPILVLQKARRVLECFTVEDPVLSVREIHTATGLPLSTCQRLVATMVAEGMLDRDGDRYRIGLQLVRWSVPGTAGLDLVRLTRPVLDQLRDTSGESAGLFVRDGPHRTLIGLSEARHTLTRVMTVGMVMPLHAGTGRVFMAYDQAAFDDAVSEGLQRLTTNTITDIDTLKAELVQTRKDGFVISRGERSQGVGSVSAPVFGATGSLEAVIGIAAPLIRIDPKMQTVTDAVVEASRQASHRLGYASQPRS